MSKIMRSVLTFTFHRGHSIYIGVWARNANEIREGLGALVVSLFNETLHKNA